MNAHFLVSAYQLSLQLNRDVEEIQLVIDSISNDSICVFLSKYTTMDIESLGMSRVHFKKDDIIYVSRTHLTIPERQYKIDNFHEFYEALCKDKKITINYH
jgi:hypothetical protein